jgi:hypothetical protein
LESLFPTADHLASWARVVPGNNESARKRRSGRTTKGNRALRTALNQAAHAAARTKNTCLSAQYHRLAGRRGAKRAIMAVAPSILVITEHLIDRKEPCKEMGGDYFDKRNVEVTAKRLTKRLEHLGYHISLQPNNQSGSPLESAVYFQVNYAALLCRCNLVVVICSPVFSGMIRIIRKLNGKPGAAHEY